VACGNLDHERDRAILLIAPCQYTRVSLSHRQVNDIRLGNGRDAEVEVGLGVSARMTRFAKAHRGPREPCVRMQGQERLRIFNRHPRRQFRRRDCNLFLQPIARRRCLVYYSAFLLACPCLVEFLSLPAEEVLSCLHLLSPTASPSARSPSHAPHCSVYPLTPTSAPSPPPSR
jgi:hypothetical protein